MKERIFCLGANHKTASIGLRESIYLDRNILGASLQFIFKKHQFQELLILSTCNRFELIGLVDDSFQKSHDDFLEIWIDLQRYAKPGLPVSKEVLTKSTYWLTGTAAIHHLFMVASSLDSLVPGETQITGQFKGAVQAAFEGQTIGPVLNRLSQDAMNIAKKVRTQTDIGKRTVSISHAAVSLAKRVFEDLSTCRFLIIGSGEMARVAAEYAKTYNPRGLVIANRSVSKAHDLATHVGATDSCGLEDLKNVITNIDIVISATSAASFILTKDAIQSAQNKRSSSSPLFLVDIALPRDIEPACSTLDDVYLFDIDDLKQVVDENIHERLRSAATATEYIDHATATFCHWIDRQKFVPIMEAWRAHVLQTLEREVQKTLSKDIFAALDEKQKEAISVMIESATSKLTADLAQSLRTASTDEAHTLARSVGHIFGLNDAVELEAKKRERLS